MDNMIWASACWNNALDRRSLASWTLPGKPVATSRNSRLAPITACVNSEFLLVTEIIYFAIRRRCQNFNMCPIICSNDLRDFATSEIAKASDFCPSFLSCFWNSDKFWRHPNQLRNRLVNQFNHCRLCNTEYLANCAKWVPSLKSP